MIMIQMDLIKFGIVIDKILDFLVRKEVTFKVRVEFCEKIIGCCKSLFQIAIFAR